jgi:hypothetical protein
MQRPQCNCIFNLNTILLAFYFFLLLLKKIIFSSLFNSYLIGHHWDSSLSMRILFKASSFTLYTIYDLLGRDLVGFLLHRIYATWFPYYTLTTFRITPLYCRNLNVTEPFSPNPSHQCSRLISPIRVGFFFWQLLSAAWVSTENHHEMCQDHVFWLLTYFDVSET